MDVEICSWLFTSIKKSVVSDLPCMWSLEQGPGFVSLRIKVVALCKGVEAMSKWKRKKYLENQVDTGEEEFSALGLALQEQFAAGVSEPCLLNT